MADICDTASDVEQLMLSAKLSERKDTGPEATGFCLNCEAPLMTGHRWCDADCREDWEVFNG